MKSYLPLLLLIIAASGCTAYKSGQTPDDVYFSPQRPQDEYVQMENKSNRHTVYNEDYREDQYLRMRVQNHMFAAIDDGPYYSYNSYAYYNNSLFFSPFYSNPYAFHNYYNPFGSFGYYNNSYYYPYYNNNYYAFHGYGGYNDRPQVYNKPRMFNLNAYTPSNGNNNRSSNSYYTPNSNNNSYHGGNTNAGNFIRNVFGGSNGNSNSGNSGNSGNSSGSSSRGSSGSSSGGGGSAPVRRF